ncbi:MAG: hypothetical protein PHQ42_01560 [Patescibacteria group bacterium]|nr:hypothetical protein [Patescibacteria group bacterium]
MTKKLLNLLIAVIFLAALAGIVYVLFFYDFTGKNMGGEEREIFSPPEEFREEGEIMVLSSENQKNLTEGKGEMSQSEITRENLKRMAAFFAERFGSYSNHSNYNNIFDLKIFMTGSMQVWADKFVEETKAGRGASDVYYGVTTKAVAAEISGIDEGAGRAEILVKTQKREASGTMENSLVSYQDILLFFIEENNFWKVDRAEWQTE